MRIGIFDSGIGGVTVLNELKTQFPDHKFLYFGDTANVPYGTKSEAQIRVLVTSAALRMREHQLDALVIACNTASSIGYAQFKEVFGDTPLIDVVSAGTKSILEKLQRHVTCPVLILGTRATIKSKIYSKLLLEKDFQLQIIEQECPLLVPLIEEGWTDHPVLRLTIAEYLRDYQKLKPGLALLACTHYPWIKKEIEACLKGWIVIDSANAVATLIAEELGIYPQADPVRSASIEWFFSDPDAVSQKLFNFGSVPVHVF